MSRALPSGRQNRTAAHETSSLSTATLKQQSKCKIPIINRIWILSLVSSCAPHYRRQLKKSSVIQRFGASIQSNTAYEKQETGSERLILCQL
jgi:hypothetical protein